MTFKIQIIRGELPYFLHARNVWSQVRIAACLPYFWPLCVYSLRTLLPSQPILWFQLSWYLRIAQPILITVFLATSWGLPCLAPPTSAWRWKLPPLRKPASCAPVCVFFLCFFYVNPGPNPPLPANPAIWSYQWTIGPSALASKPTLCI